MKRLIEDIKNLKVKSWKDNVKGLERAYIRDIDGKEVEAYYDTTAQEFKGKDAEAVREYYQEDIVKTPLSKIISKENEEFIWIDMSKFWDIMEEHDLFPEFLAISRIRVSKKEKELYWGNEPGIQFRIAFNSYINLS